MAPKAGSKRKGKEVANDDSQPAFDHRGYPSLAAFQRYSNRTIIFGRIPHLTQLGVIDFNLLMRRMGWSTFCRINEPSYPKLIRCFYANLEQPNPHRLELFAHMGNKDIKIDASGLCKLVGAPNEGDEVYDSNSWPTLNNFDPQAALVRLCKPNDIVAKPKAKDLNLKARLLLLFVQHNIVPRGGHRSEPSYFDLWLVDCILSGRKVNLGYLMIQQMSNLLSSKSGILPYGMVLTLLFRACTIDLSAETEVRMPKPSDAIDDASISRLGYELVNGAWREKGARVPDDETDEEAAMDIPPPSPRAAPSRPPTTGSSSAPPEWYHDLSQRIDTLSLDMQALSAEQDRRFDALEAQQAAMFEFLRSQFPPQPPQ